LGTALEMNKPVIRLRRLQMQHPHLKFQTLQNNLLLTYKQAIRSGAKQVQTPEFRRKKELGKVIS
jgi:N-dimethylarginine dimethylaminohydrolase